MYMYLYACSHGHTSKCAYLYKGLLAKGEFGETQTGRLTEAVRLTSRHLPSVCLQSGHFFNHLFDLVLLPASG